MAPGDLPCETRGVTERPRAQLRCPIDVFLYHDYRTFLGDYYRAKKGRGFSYRAFSRAAGLGAPNYLKLVIAGQRNLTLPMAERFAQTCGLGKEATQYFVTLVSFNQAKSSAERERHYQRLGAFARYRRAQKLELAEAAYHASWYVPAIRELAQSADFRPDPEWIASVLWPPIKPHEAKAALTTLLDLGLLETSPDGTLRQRARVVSTGAQTTGMHIRNYHAEMLRQATASMENVPANERDLTSLTMCLGPTGLERLRERIAAFRREIVELCESETQPSQVVQLNFQLFPLSLDVAKAKPRGSAPRRPTRPTRGNQT